MIRSRAWLTSSVAVLVLALGLGAPRAWPQEAPAAEPVAPAPSDPAEVPRIEGGKVEQVTVDVVVLDKKGQPVTGLARGDFTVLDEGRKQELTSFELIDRQPGSESAAAPAAARPRVVTNSTPVEQERGRTFIILFDDLHLTPLNALPAKKAVAAFLDGGAVEGDRVTVVATSGEVWWSTRMNYGRDDLMAVLKRLDGLRTLDPASERITDYEAVQIVQYHDVIIARRVEERLNRYGTSLIAQRDEANYQEAMEFFGRGVVDPYVENRAMDTYLKLKTRLGKTLEAIERVTTALAEGRDRKALILVSEGFVEDPAQPGFRSVVEAARRVNATLYFVDVTGLRALDPMYSAEFGPALDSRDHMAAIADLSREGVGAAALAEDTGGFSIRDSNAFEEGAVRIGRESQSYYLLGYVPSDLPHDGKFRKIEVKVRGDYEVRARRGYFAPSDGPPAPAGKPGVDNVLQVALDSPAVVPEIPLRVTAYAMEEAGLGRTRVLVVADVGLAEVEFREVEGASVASLDTLTVIAHRDSDDHQRTDQSVDIRLRPGAKTGSGWYSFVRDFAALPGRHQVKLIVRDTTTDTVGSVVYELEVPPHDEFRLSTPILTDTLNQSQGGPVPALVTRRAFPVGGLLYCRFDVYGAGRGPDGAPRVRAGHVLRRQGSQTPVGAAPAPSLIEPTSLGALARMVQIPLAGVSPGDYELVLTVRDEVTGETRELVEPFSVTPTVSARK